MSDYKRIETLIPYKAPMFAPKKRIGKLNLNSSIWSIAAKLGRYLLSGAEAARVGEIAKVCAAWDLGVSPEALSPAEALSGLETEVIKDSVEGPYSCFRVANDPKMLAVVAHDKAKKRALGGHGWCSRDDGAEARMFIMKLPTVLGLMEIAAGAGGAENLSDLVYSRAKNGKLASFVQFREWFDEMDERGFVERRAVPATGRAPWAEIREKDGNGIRVRFLYEDDYLEIYGTDAELEAKAAEFAKSESQLITVRMHDILQEDKWSDSRDGLGGVLRDLAEVRWDEEACRELNRRYAGAEHIAGVFEDKRNCDRAHREAASTGYLAEEFRHVEIDDDVDMDLFQSMTGEFRARDIAGELPPVDKSALDLRFRKCGRHRAIGVYSPLLNAVAIDPRAPRSLLHEFAHAYDFERGQLSTQEAFRHILKDFRERFDTEGMSAREIEYYGTPTEVFARAWEVFAASRGVGGTFVDTMEAYRGDAAYRPLIDALDEVAGYFLSILQSSSCERGEDA